MSRISNLLAQILSSVYGKDVRQSIHDAIQECYSDVSNAKTLADESAERANSAASGVESRTTSAINTMETRINTAIGNCNSATTVANNAATNANEKASIASTAASNAVSAKEACETATAAIPETVKTAFSNLGLTLQDGKLCITVERD